MRTTTDTPLDRVAERQRAVALARHYREAEGLSIAQIAQRLGRTPATVKGYFYDPTGEKARAVNTSVNSRAFPGFPAESEEALNAYETGAFANG